ncbi:putative signal peptide protein [Puccinia sorghi]|uniref:Putative signal peptide protein n=1 Tax=Puccinia sorghi TaxID=27349 RepID=A0A0L6V3P2_9BASI|nr:putative signal peptide protein [Puccinia sorghi]
MALWHQSGSWFMISSVGGVCDSPVTIVIEVQGRIAPSIEWRDHPRMINHPSSRKTNWSATCDEY